MKYFLRLCECGFRKKEKWNFNKLANFLTSYNPINREMQNNNKTILIPKEHDHFLIHDILFSSNGDIIR